MPCRRMPRTNTERLAALSKARMALEASAGAWLVPAAIGHEVVATAKQFEMVMDRVVTLSAQRVNARRTEKKRVAQAKLVVNHFLQSFYNAIERGKVAAKDTSHFGLDTKAPKPPTISKEEDVVRWLHVIATGEQARIELGKRPVADPALPEILETQSALLHASEKVLTLGQKHSEAKQTLADQIPAVQLLIKKLWGYLEITVLDLAPPARRSRLREYGVAYINTKKKTASLPPAPERETTVASTTTQSVAKSLKTTSPPRSASRFWPQVGHPYLPASNPRPSGPPLSG